MATVSYHHLTEERDALAWDLFQQTNEPYFTYRDARELATESLISSILYAVQWDATVNALRLAEPQDYDHLGRGDEPPVDEEREPDYGPQAPQRSAAQRAADKAAYHLANGLRIAYDRNGDALVPSGTRGGVIHRIHHGVCSCEASQHNRACWHLVAVQMVEEPRRAA